MNIFKFLNHSLRLRRGLSRSKPNQIARKTNAGDGAEKPRRRVKPKQQARTYGRFGRQFRRRKFFDLRSYHPGTIGLSAVSHAIIKDHGRHVRRRIRKMIAERNKKSFKVYYNGPVAR